MCDLVPVHVERHMEVLVTGHTNTLTHIMASCRYQIFLTVNLSPLVMGVATGVVTE